MPNSKTQYDRFLAKQKAGSPVTWEDVAARIDNEHDALFSFLVENDFPQVHKLLHHSDAPGTIGRGMSFTPDKKKSMGELKLLDIKRDYGTINDILKHFRINMQTKNKTTNPDLLRALENLQTIVMRTDGYGLNVKLS